MVIAKTFISCIIVKQLHSLLTASAILRLICIVYKILSEVNVWILVFRDKGTTQKMEDCHQSLQSENFLFRTIIICSDMQEIQCSSLKFAETFH